MSIPQSLVVFPPPLPAAIFCTSIWKLSDLQNACWYRVASLPLELSVESAQSITKELTGLHRAGWSLPFLPSLSLTPDGTLLPAAQPQRLQHRLQISLKPTLLQVREGGAPSVPQPALPAYSINWDSCPLPEGAGQETGACSMLPGVGGIALRVPLGEPGLSWTPGWPQRLSLCQSSLGAAACFCGASSSHLHVAH